MSTLPQLAIVPVKKEWISAEQVLRLTGWSRSTLFRRAQELTSRESSELGSNGRPVREYLLSSLPLPANAPAAQTHLTVVPPPASLLGPLFASAPAVERVLLPDPQAQAEAQARYDILAPVIDYSTNSQRYARLTLRNGAPITSLERMIVYAAEKSGQSPRTIKRWLARYRESGLSALADRIRADKGRSRWFDKHAAAMVFAAYLYLVERMSVSFVWEQIGYEVEMLGLDRNDLPSRETVRVFLQQGISPAMKTLARQGERQYRERMAPYVRRGYEDCFANQVWVGDHCIQDREIQNDFFMDVPLGTPGRLRNSTFIDYRSRYAWSTFAWEGSSRSIMATMLQAMMQVGPPRHIYVDNGKDYKKVAKGAQHGSETPLVDDEKAPAHWWENEYARIERTGLMARLGIAVTHCIPRHPQSKHVERFFRTMHMHFDALGKTYTSGNPFTRPDICEKLMMRHRRLLKAGRAADSSHPTASRFILDYMMWLEEYNNTPQNGEGMGGRSPREVFEANLDPEQRPMPEPSDLVFLMAEFVTRKVRECAITLNNYRYTPRPEDRPAWAAMHEYNDLDVLVAYNPEDPECAAALTLDGHLIAWLEAEAMLRFAPNDPETQRQIGTSMEIRRGLEKSTKKSLGYIEGVARGLGAKAPEESLRARHPELPAVAGPMVSHRKPRLIADKTAQAPASASDIARSFLEEL